VAALTRTSSLSIDCQGWTLCLTLSTDEIDRDINLFWLNVLNLPYVTYVVVH
jgi:hypothetical protein